jgi:hypothetical protein
LIKILKYNVVFGSIRQYYNGDEDKKLSFQHEGGRRRFKFSSNNEFDNNANFNVCRKQHPSKWQHSTNDIFDTLPDTGTNYDSALKSLTEYFDPVRNQDMAMYEFRQIKQEANETINNLYRRLKEKADICEFTDIDSEIRTQIIHTMSDSRLRRKALQEQLDLKALLAYSSMLEKTDMNAKLLEQNRESNQVTNHLSDLPCH